MIDFFTVLFLIHTINHSEGPALLFSYSLHSAFNIFIEVFSSDFSLLLFVYCLICCCSFPTDHLSSHLIDITCNKTYKNTRSQGYKSFLRVAVACVILNIDSLMTAARVSERQTEREWMSSRMSDKHQSSLIKSQGIEFVNGSQAEL